MPHPVYTRAAQHFEVMPCLHVQSGAFLFPNPQSLQGPAVSDPEACTPANTKPELLHLHKLLLEAGHLWNGAEDLKPVSWRWRSCG